MNYDEKELGVNTLERANKDLADQLGAYVETNHSQTFSVLDQEMQAAIAWNRVWDTAKEKSLQNKLPDFKEIIIKTLKEHPEQTHEKKTTQNILSCFKATLSSSTQKETLQTSFFHSETISANSLNVQNRAHFLPAVTCEKLDIQHTSAMTLSTSKFSNVPYDHPECTKLNFTKIFSDKGLASIFEQNTEMGDKRAHNDVSKHYDKFFGQIYKTLTNQLSLKEPEKAQEAMLKNTFSSLGNQYITLGVNSNSYNVGRIYSLQPLFDKTTEHQNLYLHTLTCEDPKAALIANRKWRFISPTMNILSLMQNSCAYSAKYLQNSINNLTNNFGTYILKFDQNRNRNVVSQTHRFLTDWSDFNTKSKNTCENNVFNQIETQFNDLTLGMTVSSVAYYQYQEIVYLKSLLNGLAFGLNMEKTASHILGVTKHLDFTKPENNLIESLRYQYKHQQREFITVFYNCDYHFTALMSTLESLKNTLNKNHNTNSPSKINELVAYLDKRIADCSAFQRMLRQNLSCDPNMALTETLTNTSPALFTQFNVKYFKNFYQIQRLFKIYQNALTANFETLANPTPLSDADSLSTKKKVSPKKILGQLIQQRKTLYNGYDFQNLRWIVTLVGSNGVNDKLKFGPNEMLQLETTLAEYSAERLVSSQLVETSLAEPTATEAGAFGEGLESSQPKKFESPVADASTEGLDHNSAKSQAKNKRAKKLDPPSPTMLTENNLVKFNQNNQDQGSESSTANWASKPLTVSVRANLSADSSNKWKQYHPVPVKPRTRVALKPRVKVGEQADQMSKQIVTHKKGKTNNN